MPHRLGPQAANALTAARIVLTPLFVGLVWRAGAAPQLGLLASLVFGGIAASDVIDGRLARRCGSATNGGRTFDHLADVSFILAALSTYTLLGITPWWVPAAIAASFTFYVVDSWSRPTARGGLIGSRVGHLGGVLNYALVGVLVCNNSAGIQALSGATLSVLFWLVPTYSALAVVNRLGARSAAAPVPGLIPR